MGHDSHQRSVVMVQTAPYHWAGQTAVLMVVALDRAVAWQLAGLEVVEGLAWQAQGGILAGREQGSQCSSVLKPTRLVSSVFMAD